MDRIDEKEQRTTDQQTALFFGRRASKKAGCIRKPRTGMTNFSAYCREQLVKGEVRHYDFQVLKEQTAYIGRIAGSINQIAKRCNENKSIHTNDVEQLRREFLELKADYLERVVKLLRKIY